MSGYHGRLPWQPPGLRKSFHFAQREGEGRGEGGEEEEEEMNVPQVWDADRQGGGDGRVVVT